MALRFKSALSYYGGKSRIIHRYPAPEYPLIIEPFAGAAAYAMKWAGTEIRTPEWISATGSHMQLGLNVHCWINDLDEKTHAIWQFLTSPLASDLASVIPASVPVGQKVSELTLWDDVLASHVVPDVVSQGMLYLLQAEANHGTQGARGIHDQVTSIGANCWPRLKRKLEWVIPHVKSFKVTMLDYRELPDVEATWFVDPPYNNPAGMRYRTSGGIDYRELGEWCKSRRGQVIVCENAGADWLDFQPLIERQGIKSSYQKSTAMEVIWTNDSVS